MKLKVTRAYTDTQLNQNLKVGFEFETTPERAKILIDKDFCISLENVTATIKAPRRNTKGSRKNNG
jgi:hypothetical protein